MPIYIIELDGKQYNIEGDREPTEEEAREALAQFNPQQIQQPKEIPTISAGQGRKQNILKRLFGASPEELNARAQNAYAISQATGTPMREVIAKNLTQNPQYTGIRREPTTSELLQSQAMLYGMPALGAGLITAPVATAGGLATGVIAGKVGEWAKPLERLVPEDASEQTKQGAKDADALLTALLAVGGYKATSKLLGKVMPQIGLSKYAQNKVVAIRKGGMREYQNMQTEYGNDLVSLSSNPQKADPTNMIGKMEEILNQRMPFLNDKGKRIPPATKVDSALYKSYNRLSVKWANSKDGKVTVGDMVSELKAIKESGGVGKPDSNTNLAKSIQRNILNAVKNDINVPKFQAMQSKYAKGMDDLDLLDKYFDIWETDPRRTVKGERFLKGGLQKSEEAIDVGNLVKQKTGQSIKGFQALNTTKRIAGNKLLRLLVGGAAAGTGFKVATDLIGE